MKKAILVSIFILSAVIPTATHASYSEEQYRIDIKQYLDLQKDYQQKEGYRRENQEIIDTMNRNYSNISTQFDTARLQETLDKQKQLSADLDKQLEELKTLQMQISQTTTTNAPVTKQKTCSELIKGSTEDGVLCVCPPKKEIKYEEDIYFCGDIIQAKKTTKTTPEETKIHTTIKPFDYSTLPIEETAPAQPVEKVGKIRTLFHSIKSNIGHFFKWVF